MADVERTTVLLRRASRGEADAANALFAAVYEELHGIAERCFRGQPSGHTLQPTALVNEAYMKLIGARDRRWADRAHFVAVAARAMRQILVDHARARGAQKRSGGGRRVSLDHAAQSAPLGAVDLLAMDEALGRLAEVDPRQAQVVELRFFAGLSVHEVAEALAVSDRTIELEWRMARAWLSRALCDGQEPV